MRRGFPFQRLVSLKGSSSALSRLGRAATCDVAPQHSKLLQSQPMQRNTETQFSDVDSDGTTSPSSDEELIFESASPGCPSNPPLPSNIPSEGLKPLHSNHPALLRMTNFAHVSYNLGVAEILTESILTLDGGWCFTPSPDEDYLLNYNYSDDECTVMAVHSLVKRAALPVETFVLAALILRCLRRQFYRDWRKVMARFQPKDPYFQERPKEIVIVSAIV
jgi:hypothetical protein